jgi:hypothetical protein
MPTLLQRLLNNPPKAIAKSMELRAASHSSPGSMDVDTINLARRNCAIEE